MGAPTHVVVVNCGSSSLKYEVIDPLENRRIAHGLVENIGAEISNAVHCFDSTEWKTSIAVPTIEAALNEMHHAFETHGPVLDAHSIAAVGHRVVMGGPHHFQPVIINSEVRSEIERYSSLAPLHNPANLQGIDTLMGLFPDVPHVAVFDTAFFARLPKVASTYAINRERAQQHEIRRYGAHGTSHQYVSRRATAMLGSDGAQRQVVLHLGNGASAAAIVDGHAVDTSMGFTPLEGLVMGTRSGDFDPAIVLYLMRRANMGIEEIDTLVNRQSGMLGLCGASDMRDIRAAIDAGDADAQLAFDIYVQRIVKYVGAYAAVMGGIDCLTFTAGVGENDLFVREAVCDRLAFLGITFDSEKNSVASDNERTISTSSSAVTVLVVPTDEEYEIANQALEVL